MHFNTQNLNPAIIFTPCKLKQLFNYQFGDNQLNQLTLQLYTIYPVNAVTLDYSKQISHQSSSQLQLIKDQQSHQKLIAQQKRQLLFLFYDSLNMINMHKSQILYKNFEQRPQIKDNLSEALIDELYQKSQHSLIKVIDARKSIAKTLHNINVLKQSKTKNLNNIIYKKNNIKQYLSCLLAFKESIIGIQESKTEKQIEYHHNKMCKNNFKLSKVVTYNKLEQIATTSILNEGKLLSISNKQYAQEILNKIMAPDCCYNQQKQGLYNLCKKYLKILTYLEYKFGQISVSNICECKITEYVSKYSFLIGEQQYKKVKSLSQSNQRLSEFLSLLFLQYEHKCLIQIQQKVIQFENQLYLMRLNAINQSLVAFMDRFQEEDFINFYRYVEERCWIFQNIQIVQILEHIIFRLLRIIYYPLVYLIFIVIAAEQRQKQARRYHKIRIMHRHLDIYKKMFNSQQLNHEIVFPKNLQLKIKTPKLPKISQLKKGTYFKELNMFLIQKSNQLKMSQKDYNDIIIQYNEKYGGTALFLINKISLLTKQSSPENTKKIRNVFVDFWSEMIAEICFKALYFSKKEKQYPLKNLKFFKQKIIERIEQKFQIQQKMDKIKMQYDQLNKRQKSKIKISQIKQIIYTQIMGVNMKTCKYHLFMKISGYIGEDVFNEINIGHKSLYYHVFK